MADPQHRGVPGVLWLTGTSYGLSFEGAQFIHLILGPATVALVVPLYRSRKLVWASLAPIAVTLLFGAPFAIISATGIAALLGAEDGAGHGLGQPNRRLKGCCKSWRTAGMGRVTDDLGVVGVTRDGPEYSRA